MLVYVYAAKKFGVTEFVNPKDYNKPVQEVFFFFQINYHGLYFDVKFS